MPGPAHRAGGEVGGDVVALGLVLHRAGPAVDDRQRVGGVEVQDEGADEHEAQDPQGVRARQERHEQLAEELAVDVDVVDLLAVVLDEPEVHLEVADHVDDDEADADDAGDRHHVLLADGRGVQVEQERLALLRPRRRAGDRPSGDRLRHEANANRARWLAKHSASKRRGTPSFSIRLVRIVPPNRNLDGSTVTARARERQPSGVSTQSATVPSGKANGARNPVWAYAVGHDERRRASPQRCQRRAGTSVSSQRAARELDDAVDDAVLRVAVADGDRRRRRVPLEVERHRASARRRPARAPRRDRRGPRRTSRWRSSTAPSARRTRARPTARGALTSSGSARAGTSHSATWSSGSPAPDERRPVPRRPAGPRGRGSRRRRPTSRRGAQHGEHPLLDAGRRVRRRRRRSSGRPAGMIRQTRPRLWTRVRYLSLDWIDELRRVVAADDGCGALAADHEIGVTQVVSDGPEGDVTYHLQVGDGEASFGAGAAEPEHVRMEQSGTPPSPWPPATSTPRRRSSTGTSGCSATSSGCSTRSPCSAPSTPCSTTSASAPSTPEGRRRCPSCPRSRPTPSG